MTALGAPKSIEMVDGPQFLGPIPLLTNKVIYDGAIIVKDAAGGYGEPGRTDTGLIVLGVADLGQWSDLAASGQATAWGGNEYAKIDMTGVSSGGRKCLVRRGCFRFKNDTGTAVTELMIGESCYILDDQTVTGSPTGATALGTVIKIFGDGSNDVAVMIGSPASLI